ncbi:Adaptin ear-binding coat-associated protein 1 [Madurella mycetomatis]|uniref:Adaptin ear-binding coat-associated protein 1 n=1 Tax=Madurella mycetomatis TaxID=100816 RepID=A0A175WCV9_9PEZI|nr:Adaptin ear-binding coat-associated protein 1 [Madurella mycetomatis]
MDPSTGSTIDPATGQPLPPDAIVRVLHITHPVHVYSIPPGTVSTKAGYAAASWTSDPRNHIFTARLRVLETSFTSSTTSASTAQPGNSSDDSSAAAAAAATTTTLKTDILLEDHSTGALFAAAPYTSPAVVDPTTDSSRFFALRVQDPTGGKKATLGIGFEERSEAFDFGVVLQEAQKALGWVAALGGTAPGRRGGAGMVLGDAEGQEKRDLSLKEGETITVNLKGTRFGRRISNSHEKGGGGNAGDEEEGGRSLASFALPPPPGSSGSGGGGGAFLPPPPSAREVRAQKRLSAQDLGFDDGQFGEFA